MAFGRLQLLTGYGPLTLAGLCLRIAPPAGGKGQDLDQNLDQDQEERLSCLKL